MYPRSANTQHVPLSVRKTRSNQLLVNAPRSNEDSAFRGSNNENLGFGGNGPLASMLSAVKGFAHRSAALPNPTSFMSNSRDRHIDEGTAENDNLAAMTQTKIVPGSRSLIRKRLASKPISRHVVLAIHRNESDEQFSSTHYLVLDDPSYANLRQTDSLISAPSINQTTLYDHSPKGSGASRSAGLTITTEAPFSSLQLLVMADTLEFDADDVKDV